MAEALKSPLPRTRSSAFADYAPTYGAAAALILLILGNIAFTPNFADIDNFRNILVQVTPTMVVAVGMTFVIATGGIDLSVGSLMAIASAVAAVCLEYGAFPAILAGLAVVSLIGAFSGWLISTFKIQPIIVTLAMLIAGRGIAQVISNGGQLIPFSNESFEFLGKGSLLNFLPMPIFVMTLIVGLAIFVLRSTIFGRYVIAVGGNENAARLSGISVRGTKIAIYALSGLLAGIAGLIYTARLGASDASQVGVNIELDAIAATVVGGTALSGGRATIIGTVIGALIMVIITTSFVMNDIKYPYSLVIKAAIILFVVYLQRSKSR
ncbi:MAG: ABC transporter permease [bacterium]|nr:ABC transporter permease [bacterium]